MGRYLRLDGFGCDRFWLLIGQTGMVMGLDGVSSLIKIDHQAAVGEMQPLYNLPNRPSSSNTLSTSLKSPMAAFNFNSLYPIYEYTSCIVAQSSTVSLARLEVPAPTTTWSRCSRRRWPEMETTPMTSLSRLSRPTTRRAKLTPRCSHTP